MKSATKRVAGRSYSSSGVPELLDTAGVHDRDPVAHRERLFLVVRHVDERDADLSLDPLELDLELAPELQVERSERLVEQEDVRPVHERPGERHALLLTARQRGRLAAVVALQPHELEHLPDAPRDLGPSDVPPSQPEADVGRRRRGAGRARSCWKTMLTGRLSGGSSVTSRSRSRIRPAVGRSKPPIILRVVVLPQPDGPRSEKNSAVRMSSVTPSTARTSPKRFSRPIRRISAEASLGTVIRGRAYVRPVGLGARRFGHRNGAAPAASAWASLFLVADLGRALPATGLGPGLDPRQRLIPARVERLPGVVEVDDHRSVIGRDGGPLRASRSISAQTTRLATDSVTYSRSMRIPSLRWNIPAR